MDGTDAVCCGSWCMFLVAMMTIVDILSPAISDYIKAKAEEIRSRVKKPTRGKA